MRNHAFQFLLTLAVLMGLITTFTQPTPVKSNATTIVSIKPSAGQYDLGDEIAVEVWVENVVDLYGADVQLKFNPLQLEVLNQEIIPVGDLLQPDFVAKETVDNAAGTIWYVATQLNPTPPANGSGALFKFTFKVVGQGIGDVTITDQILATRNADVIAAQVQNARYLLGDVAFQVFMPVAIAD